MREDKREAGALRFQGPRGGLAVPDGVSQSRGAINLTSPVQSGTEVTCDSQLMRLCAPGMIPQALVGCICPTCAHSPPSPPVLPFEMGGLGAVIMEFCQDLFL